MSKKENKKLFENAIKLFENKTENEYQYILRRLKYLSSNDCLDDYMDSTYGEFTLNMNSINDYKEFIENNYNEYSKISPALFINDEGNVSLQKTYENSFFYIIFKGNHKVNFNFKQSNEDKFIKDADINFMISKLKEYILTSFNH